MTGPRSSPSRRPGQRGAVTVEWTLGIAVLVLPVVLLVGVLPGWVERQSMARLAAREAARAAVLAGDAPTGAAAGEALAREIAANHGVRDSEVHVAVVVPVGADGQPVRDGTASATVEVAVPFVTLPGFGTLGGWTLSATHHEPLDRYRSLAP